MPHDPSHCEAITIYPQIKQIKVAVSVKFFLLYYYIYDM